MRLKPLEWSENRQPNSEVHYNHCIAETPFGRFLLTWKGWKEDYDQGITLDETPFGLARCGTWDNWDTIDEAKQAVQDEMNRCILGMLSKHAADDAELITEDWLDETFGSREYGCLSWSLDEVGNLYAWICGNSLSAKRDSPNALVTDITTRGQLRLLLRALSQEPQP